VSGVREGRGTGAARIPYNSFSSCISTSLSCLTCVPPPPTHVSAAGQGTNNFAGIEALDVLPHSLPYLSSQVVSCGCEHANRTPGILPAVVAGIGLEHQQEREGKGDGTKEGLYTLNGEHGPAMMLRCTNTTTAAAGKTSTGLVQDSWQC